MARIRTIKPEFFTSEQVLTLSAWARLLFIALWCEADREGRLAWKPKTFKLRYFPGDEVDIEALCHELLRAELVRLYGDGLAHIPTFAKHQLVNPREAKSTLPAPDGSRVTDAHTTRHLPVTVVSGGQEESTRHLPVTDAHVGRKEGKEGKEGTAPSLVEQRAGAWLEQFPVRYHEARGVGYRVNHTRDWPNAVIVAEAVPDDETLNTVTDVFLRCDHRDLQGQTRTPGRLAAMLPALLEHVNAHQRRAS